MDRPLSVVWNYADQKAGQPEPKFVSLCVDYLLRKSKWLQSPGGLKEFNAIVKKEMEKKKKEEELAAQKKKEAEKPKPTKATRPKPVIRNKSPDEIIDCTDLADDVKEDPPKPDAESKDGDDSDDEEKGMTPVNNGGKTDKYVWSQSLSELELRIEVPALRGRDFTVEFKNKHLKVGVKGKPPIVDGDLHDAIDTEDSTWSLAEERGVDGKVMTVTLVKKKGMNWWNKVCVGDPEINTKKIDPENSKLDDLDPETRQTVQKMMFDQRQKQMGKPTSKEMEQNAMLKKFMAAHPEMDFSKCKMPGGMGGGMAGMMGGMNMPK